MAGSNWSVQQLDKWTAVETEVAPLKGLLATFETLLLRLAEINVCRARVCVCGRASLSCMSQASLKSPEILKNRGGIRLRVEKEKNVVRKELPRCETRIHELLSSLAGRGEELADLRVDGLAVEEHLLALWTRAEAAGDKENERRDKPVTKPTTKPDLSRTLNSSTASISSNNNRVCCHTDGRSLWLRGNICLPIPIGPPMIG